MASLEDRIIDVLDSITDEEYVDIYNAIVQDTRKGDFIYYMTEFDEVAEDFTPSGLLQSLDDKFSIKDTWFVLDSTDTFYSFSDLLDYNCPAKRDDMVKIIVSEREAFDNDDIQEVLDSSYDEEEE